jgi:hypothetical protein
MSTQPLPEPVSRFTPFDAASAQPAPSDRPRCRALTVEGRRCKNKVLGGLHLCFSHYRNRRPALPEPANVSVPLLEDRAAIRLVTTQVLHGVLSHRIDPIRARVALQALRIAALTLPRPAVERPGSAEPADDPVCRIGRDHDDFISADGDLAAPALNPSCSVAESAEAARALLDTLEPQSRVHPEDEAEEPPPVDDTHDFERCACLTCAAYRHWFKQQVEAARLRNQDEG